MVTNGAIRKALISVQQETVRQRYTGSLLRAERIGVADEDEMDDD
jgi:hypothetical protein